MRSFCIIILCCAVYACSSDVGQDKNKIVRGFYNWKSSFDLDDHQISFLRKINAKVLYVKYFDVVHNGIEYYPVAELSRVTDDYDLNIVPTIYITTDVFSRIDSTEIPILADNVASKINRINGVGDIKEIQFDCDWTASIKDKYFSFLEEIKQFFPETKFSATIRLYQYKYSNLSGVPPVDKGLLMYYNMGELMNYEEKNSILNNATGEQYLGFGEYPLPLDIAIPNFKWALLFRQGKFQQICPEFTEKQLNNKDLFSSTKENWYTFKRDTVMRNTYFRFGDELRFEHCSEDDLLEAAELLKEEINQEETNVLFYDLQPNTHLEYEKIDAVFSAFNK